MTTSSVDRHSQRMRPPPIEDTAGYSVLGVQLNGMTIQTAEVCRRMNCKINSLNSMSVSID
ncbi:hypothetical protein RE6C_02308 [Rhodopirellula europaea 6C]|uniref:Uncharacterized protein n=1 Tax=Rhodopirellula europaea 6C TaxID=1263867 RepID=M2AID0_9BACT|nr:hypothetical protein RE6C_02308 [Rhodopirellula europaea 6C]